MRFCAADRAPGVTYAIGKRNGEVCGSSRDAHGVGETNDRHVSSGRCARDRNSPVEQEFSVKKGICQRNGVGMYGSYEICAGCQVLSQPQRTGG